MVKSFSNCDEHTSTYDETKNDGYIKISDLLHKPFEKHIATFEIPNELRHILDADEINAVISWYLDWSIKEIVEKRTTCEIKNIFGYEEAVRVIIAINLYKYLRNKTYDPNVIEKIIKTH